MIDNMLNPNVDYGSSLGDGEEVTRSGGFDGDADMKGKILLSWLVGLVVRTLPIAGFKVASNAEVAQH